jgi:hypothetical protein
MAKGQISFESRTSELLKCSCGNDVMDSGFDVVLAECESLHYECGKCGAAACVDFDFRTVFNSPVNAVEEVAR